MKSRVLYLSIISILMLLTFSGCTTTDKFFLSAPAGTSLYLTTNSTPYIYSSNEPAKIEVPSSAYYGYVVAKDPITGLEVPWGIDVRRKVYHGEKLAVGTGYALSGTGLGLDAISVIAMIAAAANEDDDMTTLFGIMTGIGSGIAGIGVAIGLPADSRLKQLSHHYQFAYVNSQSVNFDGLSTTLLHPDKPKNESYSENTDAPKRKKASSGISDLKQSDNSTKVNKTRSDSGKKISGKYSGTGRLLSGKVQEEYYSTIDVIIERIDKDNVSVRVVESDDDFFESPMMCLIKSDKKGGYILTVKNVPSVKITIDKQGNIKFFHDKVNIDSDLYTLSISAKKK